MSDANQLAEDLQFVRRAVEARDKPLKSGNGNLIVWAIYCLVCIPTYDFIPQYGGRINLAGFICGMILSFIIGKREGRMSGQYDRSAIVRVYMHFLGGSVLLMLTTFGLAALNRGVNGEIMGQVSIILVGFMYFYGGLHVPNLSFMRWVGPIIIAAGVCLSLVPRYPWTLMACIFAVCILSPVLFGKRQPVQA
jgi:hypothetical protein